jgi:L-lysine exporter family protein LysE/ArgO
MIYIFLSGFILGLSQIAAIGLQNMFVLKNGIQKKPMFFICVACALCDILMICFGIFFAGASISANNKFISIFQILGSSFLLFYGIKLLKNAFTKTEFMDLSNIKTENNKSTILAVIAVSILNPHAWVDAVIVIGAMSTKYIDIDKIYFAFGCIIASIVWFFTLGYFSKKISHWFEKPKTWKILDLTMAFVMFYLSYNLAFNIN